MIPKVIHYCWFGHGLMPKSQKDCIKEWQRLMPDYTIIRWDESNFDPDQCLYTSVAYRQKKYAFVSDVCRLNALSQHGGIYMDTDVELFQSLDPFLDCNLFSGIELYRDFFKENIAEKYLNPDGTPRIPGTDIPHLEILTSMIGCTPNNPLISDLLSHYTSIDNLSPNTDLRQLIIFDRLMARCLVPYGFRYIDEKQQLENNMIIYNTGTFGYAYASNPDYTVSFHHNATTWDPSVWSKKDKFRYLLDKLGLKKKWRKIPVP